MQGPECKVFELVGWAAKAVYRAIRVLAWHFFVNDQHATLGWNEENGSVLELASVYWIVNGAVDGGNAEADQKAAFRVIRPVGGLAPTVVAMAGGTGKGVVGGAEAIPGYRA